MRLKDLQADAKQAITSALQHEADALQALKDAVEENGTTLPGVYNTLCSVQQRIDQLAILVARLAEEDVR